MALQCEHNGISEPYFLLNSRTISGLQSKNLGVVIWAWSSMRMSRFFLDPPLGGGKVNKTRPRKKPYVKKQKDIISPDNNTSTPGNSGEVTTSEGIGDDDEEENPLLKIIRYVHYKLFKRSAVYCDGCTHQFADSATGIISDQSLEMNPWKCTRSM